MAARDGLDIRFSVSAEPGRLSILHEVAAPLLNIRVSPLADQVRLSATVDRLPGVSVVHAVNSEATIERGDLSRQSDSFEFVWSASDTPIEISHLGQALDVPGGAAILVSSCDPHSSRMAFGCRPVIVTIDRSVLLPMLPHSEALMMRPIARNNASFTLLRAYLKALAELDEDALEARQLAAGHIRDLVALCVGTSPDAAAYATNNGAQAARLAAVKLWIHRHLADPGLSVERAARPQGIGPRALQKLFERDGTTFSAFVLGERLKTVRARLESACHATRSIGAIALEAGFNDISYFNRSFRAAFGMSPRDVRAASRDAGDALQAASFSP